MTAADLLQLTAPLDDLAMLFCTVWGEARNQSPIGIAAVAQVIRNRVDAPQFPNSYKAVCLAPAQFSCWWEKGTQAEIDNTKKVYALAHRFHNGRPGVDPDVPDQRVCYDLANYVMGHRYKSIKPTVCHYVTRSLYESDRCPTWAKRLSYFGQFGSHVLLE